MGKFQYIVYLLRSLDIKFSHGVCFRICGIWIKIQHTNKRKHNEKPFNCKSITISKLRLVKLSFFFANNKHNNNKTTF